MLASTADTGFEGRQETHRLNEVTNVSLLDEGQRDVDGEIRVEVTQVVADLFVGQVRVVRKLEKERQSLRITQVRLDVVDLFVVREELQNIIRWK